MREIKFRAKTIRAGKWSKWIYGSLDFTKYTYQEARMVGYDDPSQYWHKIDKNTIGQFTGLKDKNGKEIYENDIVEVTRPCVYETGVVINKNGCFFIKVKETLLPLYECEINNYKLKVIRKRSR